MGNIGDLMGGGFDTNRDDAATGYTIIPTGWYPAIIENAEIKDNSKGTGKILAVQYEIIGDNFSGRKMFSNFNIVNPNQKAVEIAQRELAGLGQACAIPVLTDTTELLGKMIQIRIKVVPGSKTRSGEDENTVGAFKPLDQTQPTTQQPMQSQQSTPTPMATQQPEQGQMPWERK
jgi:hypothetical protein